MIDLENGRFMEQVEALTARKRWPDLRDMLVLLEPADIAAVLAELLVQASSTGKEEVIFSDKDRRKVGKAAVEKANKDGGKKLALSGETRSIPGGFILRSENVEVNCAFDTLVRLQKAETAGEVVKKLFS